MTGQTQANLEIKDFLQSQGLDISTRLSPSRIVHHLKTEWHIEDEETTSFVLQELSDKCPGDFLDSIEQGLMDKPYAQKVFLTLKQNPVFVNLCRSVHLEEGLYRLAVLDVLTRKSEHDFIFFKRVYLEYNRLIEEKYFARSQSKLEMLRQGTLFTYIKYLTVDTAIKFRFRVHEETNGLDLFRQTRLVRFLLLPLNIAEASITDFFHGNFKNAFVGSLLTQSPVHRYKYDRKHKQVWIYCRSGYQEAYLLWNLAFCLRKDSQLIQRAIVKLLFPHILQAPNRSFVNIRAISLWYCLQAYFLAQDEHLASDYRQAAEICAEVVGSQALRASLSFKKQKSLEFLRNLMSFYRSERE